MGILCCFQSGADKLHDAAGAPNKKPSSDHAANLRRRYQDAGNLATLVDVMVAESGIQFIKSS